MPAEMPWKRAAMRRRPIDFINSEFNLRYVMRKVVDRLYHRVCHDRVHLPIVSSGRLLITDNQHDNQRPSVTIPAIDQLKLITLE